MVTFKELLVLSQKYGYDANHNLRYLTLSKIVSRYQIKELLVLGCGKGILESILPNEVRCVSVDLNPDDIAYAREINCEKTGRTFIVGDVLALPAEFYKKFDGVLISEVIEHIGDDHAVMEIARRCMKPLNSYLILTVPHSGRFLNKAHVLFGREKQLMHETHLREYVYGDVLRLLSKAGLNCVYTEYVYFKFPKERIFRKLIALDNPIRAAILKLFPGWGDYIITVSTGSVHAGSEIKPEKYIDAYERERTAIVKSMFARVPFNRFWRVLDLGSGSGFYADLLKKYSDHITTADILQTNVEQCLKKGYKAVHCDLEKPLAFKSEEFDFINCLELIEHLNDPFSFIKEVRRIIKPGGYLLISTANKCSPEGLKGKLVQRLKNEKWNAWDITHRHIFGYDEFIGMLEKEFGVVYVVGYYFGFSVFNRNMPPILWKARFSNALLRRFGFDIIVLVRK